MQLKFKKVHSKAKLPTYGSPGAACFDFYAVIDPNPIFDDMDGIKSIKVGVPDTFRTGLQVEVPEGHVLLIFSRSGYGFVHNVRLTNCVGVIDSDYRGEIMVKLTKDLDVVSQTYVVSQGERIAQGMLVPIPRCELVEVRELGNTVRGENGFGSTGK
ncbi:MAG: dUTP diphosphatase [Pseudomonadota bacterium]|nr:dUTP diphosphatase [Pseudomonadota bacterium]